MTLRKNIAKGVARHQRAGARKRKAVISRNPKTARVARAVAKQVVGRALAENIETHSRDVTLATLEMSAGTVYGINPLFHIPQSVSEADKIGDRISRVKLHLQGTYYHYGQIANVQSMQSSKLRVMVVSIPKHWANTSEGTWLDIASTATSGSEAISTSDIWKGGDTASNRHLCYPNYNNVRVLFDRVYSDEFPNALGTVGGGSSNFTLGRGVPVDLHIPLGNIGYLTNSAPFYTKDRQILVLVCCSGLYGQGLAHPGIGDRTGYFQGKLLTSWRDA